jgi:hypothetical protein
MKRLNSINPYLPSGAGAIILALVIGMSVAGCAAGPERKADGASPGNTTAGSQRPLTGAELYAVNCNRCHPERSPTEWNAAQWQTILTHMRVRANLPAAQARVILKYLQENSGT